MIRTFIAVELHPCIRHALARDIDALRPHAPHVKWSKTENLHLTLRFLGDVKENDLEELFDALRESVAGFMPFAMEIKGVGVFPNWRHPRIVCAGCGDGSEDVVRLAGLVEETCVELGYEKGRRHFSPHMTLGRVKLSADAEGLAGVVEAGAEKKIYGFLDVDAVVVFMSSLRRNGPVYSPMAKIELG